jgi:hypothetical protein
MNWKSRFQPGPVRFWLAFNGPTPVKKIPAADILNYLKSNPETTKIVSFKLFKKWRPDLAAAFCERPKKETNEHVDR